MDKFIHELQVALQYGLFTVAGTKINLATLLVVILIAVASMWISRIAGRALEQFFKRRGLRDVGSLEVSKRLTHYAVLALGFGVAIHTLGVDLTALFAAGAVFAIGLGFAMQNIAQNFVSGLILLVERVIKPGDVLEVDGTIVKVVRMGIRATVARTLDEEDLIIPNSMLAQSTVKNYTLRDSEFRVRTVVGVVYGSDMKLVRQTLTQAAHDVSQRHLGRPPRILLQEFGSSSVDFEVSIWITDPWNLRTIRSELNEELWWALKKVGVTIAFPQVDVHLDPDVMDSLQRLSVGR